MVRATDPVVMTDAVVREIAQEIHRKFALVSSNIQFHVDQHVVMVVVHVDEGRVVMPHGPRDIRITDGHPVLESPEF